MFAQEKLVWVKCWNRPVTISPRVAINVTTKLADGEVLEQTSYYITQYWSTVKPDTIPEVKCWNRPVTISPINTVHPFPFPVSFEG